jgi:predicted dehydrogenase
MSDLKCAVVGLGLGKHFVAALDRNERIGETVVCDPDAERTAAAVGTFVKVRNAYTDLHRMLEAEAPDLVCLVTPDHMHRLHAETCFEAGCHVLQTKPLATNLPDARAIVKASRAVGLKLMVAHERRFRPSVMSIKAALDGARSET